MENFMPLALAVIFEVLKNKKSAAKFRAAILKLHITIQALASSDPELDRLINPKPNA